MSNNISIKQIWKIGNSITLMQELDDASVDLILTDPPYGLNIDYGDLYIDTRENLIKLLDKIIPQMMRVGKRIAILPGISQVYLYPKPDWIFSISWSTTGSRGYFGYTQWMPILIYGEDIKGIGKVNGVLKSDSFHTTTGGVGALRDKYEKMHPCPKPYMIIEWLIKRLSNKYETVLDPFCGSGTTLLACRKTERNGIGFELNPKYEILIQERCMADTPPITEYF